MSYRVTLAAAALLVTSTLSAQTPTPNEYPAEVQMLVQSEFDYLVQAEHKISIELNEALPLAALDQIGKQAKISIVIQGRLPRAPKLTRSFTKTPLKEILTWYSDQVPVVFKVSPAGKLTIVSPHTGIEKTTVGLPR